MHQDETSRLTTLLSDSLQAATACIQLADHEVRLASESGDDSPFHTVPASQIVDLANVTTALEASLTRVLSHMDPEAAASLSAFIQLESGPCRTIAESRQTESGRAAHGPVASFPSQRRRDPAS